MLFIYVSLNPLKHNSMVKGLYILCVLYCTFYNPRDENSSWYMYVAFVHSLIYSQEIQNTKNFVLSFNNKLASDLKLRYHFYYTKLAILMVILSAGDSFVNGNSTGLYAKVDILVI